VFARAEGNWLCSVTSACVSDSYADRGWRVEPIPTRVGSYGVSALGGVGRLLAYTPTRSPLDDDHPPSTRAPESGA